MGVGYFEGRRNKDIQTGHRIASEPAGGQRTGVEFASSFRNMRFPGAPSMSRWKDQAGCGIASLQKREFLSTGTNDRASASIYTTHKRMDVACVCACVKKVRKTTERGHYWILSIPGVIKIRSQPRGRQWHGTRKEQREDMDRVYLG